MEAQRLAAEPTLALICGHYQGVDERIRQHLATEELSIGDYVLTGGELAAMVVVDAVVRLLPGVLGSAEAAPRGLIRHRSAAASSLHTPRAVPRLVRA